MQRKRLFLVLMISCICLLPIDAEAQAGAVGKILKGTAKAAKSHSYEFSRAGIATEFEKHYRQNGNHRDSIYWDSLNRIRPIYMDPSVNRDSLNKNRPFYDGSPIKRDSLNVKEPKDVRNFKELARYRELEFDDYDEEYNRGKRIDDFLVLESQADSVKAIEDTTDKVSRSNAIFSDYSEENNSFVWKLSLGLLIFIAIIICCGLKLFNKKGKTK